MVPDRGLVCIASRHWPGYAALRIAYQAMAGIRRSERWALRT
jgi:hypothetical protein